MRTRTRALSMICTAAGSLLLGACRSTPPPNHPEGAARQLEALATTRLHLDFAGKVSDGAAYNIVGIHSETMLFSHRIDSRTYFVQDKRYGVGRTAGVFSGSDEELLRSARQVASLLGVQDSEIDGAAVLRVESNVAGRDRASGQLVAEGARLQERFARLTRRIEGVPVFSSRVLLGLTRDQRIGFLEFHWPDIPKQKLLEAQRYVESIRRGWSPPVLRYAKVESVEAGILHSPAAAFVMEVQPVIRVIYAPEGSQAGKKPVLYLNAEGKPVAMPRQFEKLPQHPLEKRPAAEGEKP
jgi:hypothetical protein